MCSADLDALRATIERADVDLVVAATPIDVDALLRPDKRVVRARYDYADVGEPSLGTVVDGFLKGRLPAPTA